MYADRDFDQIGPLQPRADALVADLGAAALFSAMSGDDVWLSKVIHKAVTQPLVTVDEVLYRQDALRDAIEHEEIVRAFYGLATEVIENERKRFYRSGRSPSSVLYWSVELLEMLAKYLRRLRASADANADLFQSVAFRRLLTALREELSDDYLDVVERHLRILKFRDGMLLSARLGEGNKGTDYVLREPPRDERGWFARFFDLGRSGPFTLRISDRDESGARALADLRDRGLNGVVNAVAQACDHLLSFFDMLRAELGFYVGCLNLRSQLLGAGLPLCFPEPVGLGSRALLAEDVYDPCLALHVGEAIVRNDVNADGKALVVVTGANQGGKSTFLRAIGLSYVMMQAGMFVPARSLRAGLSSGIFTHFKREEDVEMKSGKLDEELRRMSDIVDALRPHDVVLFNESFASTNEREGSEIARQITTALLESGVRVMFVTHHFEFTRILGERDDALFLRAERLDDGTRTFKLVAGRPLETSFGIDLYRNVFEGPSTT